MIVNVYFEICVTDHESMKLCFRSKACIPYLIKSSNPHIINISPPLNMNPLWFKNHVGYTMAKYGMSMCVLGMAEEFKPNGIAVNAVWPKTGKLSLSNSLLSMAKRVN